MTRQQIDQIYMHDPNHVMDAPIAAPSTATIPNDTPVQPAQVATAPVMIAQPDAPITTTPQPEPSVSQTISHTFHQQPLESTNPYDRTHSEEHLQADAKQWGEYHSAWQNYYQQYFHRYYAGHLMQTQAELEAERSKLAEHISHENSSLSPEDAMDEIRSGLRGKIQAQTKKVRKSRHFIPIVSAVVVMGVFLFLQYGPILVGYAAAYASPGAINPSNIIIDAGSSTVVSADPQIIIPKINVQAPVIYDNTMGTTDQDTYNKQMAAMQNGVAWFGIPGADSLPGQNGNTVLSGHSSNALFENGNYKFVFAKLEQLATGDVIYVNYKSTRYSYKITELKVVMPSDVGALQRGSDKPYLTLITCTPLGTSQKRLLVFAEQVSPSPTQATQAPTTTAKDNSASIPGNSPSFFERLFGG